MEIDGTHPMEAVVVAEGAINGRRDRCAGGVWMTRTDQELMQRIGKRDAEAFDALFARHAPAVRRHLARTLRDEGAADDLMQEAFLRVWLHADGWQGRGAVTGWLFRIATNLALNHLRSARRRPQQPLEDSVMTGDEGLERTMASWLTDPASPDPETLYEQAERRERLHRLIDDLPEEKREVVRLVHEAELEPFEVAALLGLPEGTIRSRLHYARKRLAREWRRDDA
jgi:RNA polymerase sigma-70 factor (ECF subfamily)